MDDPIARHVELLHAYHLDLWSEMEAQIRVIRAAQEEISKLRQARSQQEERDVALHSAEVLARHVHTLKGRVRALGETANELEGTVAVLVTLLKAEP